MLIILIILIPLIILIIRLYCVFAMQYSILVEKEKNNQKYTETLMEILKQMPTEENSRSRLKVRDPSSIFF